MDAQRWKHSKLTADSKNSSPILSTPLSIEKKCAEFYTPPVFYDFQEELKGACYSCNEANKSTKERDVERLFVMDRESKKVYEVDVDGKTLVCSCKRFQRFGILCRHCVWVLHNKGFDEIPSEYLLPRDVKKQKAHIETLLGSKIPTKAHILPPNQAKNKGSGRRMTSEKEKAMEEHAKPLRKCRACGEMARHDSRNCPSQLPNN
ncbi:protein FAR1-RELATED SEQUENCE 9-like [Silene latifolia]|uniref:protein FAR1-RELATED SEQUENCE 9-like n=1 Tax=Silene latifolia TaxID=37657 RepID=UPI003D788F32